MKSWLPSLIMLIAVGLLTFAGGTPAPESTFGSTAVVQLEAEPVAVAEVDESPLTVGPPPESLIVLTSGGELFTQPAVQEFPIEKPAPVKKAEPAASGQWVTRYAGFRGRRSYVEWVPAAGASSDCANGSCSSAGYFRGGCASCR